MAADRVGLLRLLWPLLPLFSSDARALAGRMGQVSRARHTQKRRYWKGGCKQPALFVPFPPACICNWPLPFPGSHPDVMRNTFWHRMLDHRHFAYIFGKEKRLQWLLRADHFPAPQLPRLFELFSLERIRQDLLEGQELAAIESAANHTPRQRDCSIAARTSSTKGEQAKTVLHNCRLHERREEGITTLA